MAKFQITNTNSGADLGTVEADSAIEAHAAMITDAGYDVSVVNGELVFADAESARIDDGDIEITEVAR